MSLDPMIIPMEVVSSDVIIPMEVATKYESPIELETLEVDHNEVYNSPSKKAWNKVIVDVAAPTGRKKIINNGIHDVLDYAEVDVNVPNSYTASDEGKVVQNGELVGQTVKSINSNGTVDTTVNNQVIVNVPNSYDISDEGKVVNNQALVAQTARTVDTNGMYDTTTNNSVTVNVQLPTPPDENKPVKFYDYDGTLLYSYTLVEAQALTELPAQPTHTGLTAMGWNWTLADIKSLNAPVIVGGHYKTSDGVNRFYIKIIKDIHRRISLYLRLSGTLEINWGDDSAVETLTLDMILTGMPPVIDHEYNTVGEYCIGLKIINGVISGGYSFHSLLKFPEKSTQFGVGRSPTTANFLITKIEGGDDPFIEFAWFGALADTNAVAIAIPSKLWLLPSNDRTTGLQRNNSLRFVAIPSGFLTLSGSMLLQNCFMEYCSLPHSLTSFGTQVFMQCTNLKEITIPPQITTLSASLFCQCYNLQKVHLPPGLTTIERSVFQDCLRLEDINFPSSITSIGAQSFTGSSISDLQLPASLTNIGSLAFNSCAKLLHVKIPHLIRTIGNQVFAYCKNVITYDMTDWTNSDLDACTFGTNIFQNLTADTAILFKYKSVADHAATVTNLSTYASYFAYEEDDT